MEKSPQSIIDTIPGAIKVFAGGVGGSLVGMTGANLFAIDHEGLAAAQNHYDQARDNEQGAEAWARSAAAGPAQHRSALAGLGWAHLERTDAAATLHRAELARQTEYMTYGVNGFVIGLVGALAVYAIKKSRTPAKQHSAGHPWDR